jgi:hypothetical protein
VLNDEKLDGTGVSPEHSPHTSFRPLAEETGLQSYRLQVGSTFMRKLQIVNVNIIQRYKE